MRRPTFSVTRSQSLSWLLLVLSLALIFGVPALLDRHREYTAESAVMRSEDRHDFDDRYIEEMRVISPKFVFIGNSTVEASVDVKYLDGLTAPKRSYLLYARGSGSATWYILFKHQLIPSGVKPETLFFFFKDEMLTSPNVGLPGWLWDYCRRWIGSDDPLLDRILAGAPTGWKQETHYRAREVYPVEARGAEFEAFLRGMFKKKTYPGGPQKPTPSPNSILADEVNELFSPNLMRQVSGPNSVPLLVEADRYDFDHWLSRSFLPPIIELGKQGGIPLAFVRIKARPEPNSHQVRQSPELIQYMQRLRDYLQGEGCLFVDFTDDPEIDYSWYADKDYVNESHKQPFTRKLFDAFPQVFQ